MSSFNLPEGCFDDDLPSNSPENVAWENALEEAAIQIDAGQFDTDDVIKAVSWLTVDDIIALVQIEKVRDMMIELRTKEISE